MSQTCSADPAMLTPTTASALPIANLSSAGSGQAPADAQSAPKQDLVPATTIAERVFTSPIAVSPSAGASNGDISPVKNNSADNASGGHDLTQDSHFAVSAVRLISPTISTISGKPAASAPPPTLQTDVEGPSSAAVPRLPISGEPSAVPVVVDSISGSGSDPSATTPFVEPLGEAGTPRPSGRPVPVKGSTDVANQPTASLDNSPAATLAANESVSQLATGIATALPILRLSVPPPVPATGTVDSATTSTPPQKVSPNAFAEPHPAMAQNSAPLPLSNTAPLGGPDPATAAKSQGNPSDKTVSAASSSSEAPAILGPHKNSPATSTDTAAPAFSPSPSIPASVTVPVDPAQPQAAPHVPTPTAQNKADSEIPGAAVNLPQSQPSAGAAASSLGPVQAAQILGKAEQAEMRIGLTTSAFGSVEVRTVVHANDVGVLIGNEKGDLRSLLANELPAIAHNLQQQDLRLNQVTFHQGVSFSNNLSSGGNSQPRTFVSRSSRNSAAESTSREVLGSTEPQSAFASGSGRLSVLA